MILLQIALHRLMIVEHVVGIESGLVVKEAVVENERVVILGVVGGKDSITAAMKVAAMTLLLHHRRRVVAVVRHLRKVETPRNTNQTQMCPWNPKLGKKIGKSRIGKKHKI